MQLILFYMILIIFKVIAMEANLQISSVYEAFEQTIDQACKHWNEARKLIDLDPILENDCPSIKKFYTTGELFAVNISNNYMVYSSIWKAGNNAIRYNMIYNEGVNQNSSYQLFPSNLKLEIKRELRKYSRQYNVRHSNSYLIIKSMKENVNHNVQAFTFVRNPLDHFISGLNEYHHLTRIYSEKRNEDHYNTFYFKKDIIDILNLHQRDRHKWILRHLYSMVGSLKQSIKVNFIGKLDNISNDWLLLQQYYNIKLQPFHSELGLHPLTSNDKYKVFDVYHKLIQDEPKYKLIICHILYLDYIIFNYTLPIECSI